MRGPSRPAIPHLGGKLAVILGCFALHASSPTENINALREQSKAWSQFATVGTACRLSQDWRILRLRGGTTVKEHAPTCNDSDSDLSGALSITDSQASKEEKVEKEEKIYERVLRHHEENCKHPLDSGYEIFTTEREEEEALRAANNWTGDVAMPRFWRNTFQKKASMIGPMWGDALPNDEPIPSGAIQPWGSAALNDTWVGEFPDGSPALYGHMDRSHELKEWQDCSQMSKSEDQEHVGELVGLYRERYANTTPPHLLVANETRERGFWRWFGRGSRDPEGLVDEFSDGGWGERHWEVGRFVPMVNLPMHQQRMWRMGKEKPLGEDGEELEGSDDASASGNEGGESDDALHEETAVATAPGSPLQDEAAGEAEDGGGERDGPEGVETKMQDRDAANIEATRTNGAGRMPRKKRKEKEESSGSDYDLPLILDPETEGGGGRLQLLVTTQGAKSGKRRYGATDEYLNGTYDGPELWNYTFEEQQRNQLLRDQKWRRWRKQRDEYEDKHRPLWLPPLPDNESTFNMSYLDGPDKPFPASAGRDLDEAVENTVEAYAKYRLDRLAKRWHDTLLEWDAARYSPEDPSRTPWMERDGFKFRYRHSYGGFCENLEVKWDEDDYVCGSPEARKEVEDEIMKSMQNSPKLTCHYCDDYSNSQNEEGYCRRLKSDPANVSTLCDYGVLLAREERAEAETVLEQALNLSRNQSSEPIPPARFPPRVTVCHNLGIVKACRGAYEDAEALFREALEVYPTHVSSMVKLGEVLEDERDALSEAEELYRRASELEPLNKHALYSYGTFLLFVRRDPKAAEPHLQMGCRLDPGWVVLQVHFSFMILLKGRRDQARDGLRWASFQEDGKTYALGLALYGYIQHNPRRASELRKLNGYSGVKARSRLKLRAMSKQMLQDGDDSSDHEHAMQTNDLLEYQPAYAFTDIDKVRVLVRDLATAEEAYRQALALHPTQRTATIGLATLLAELRRCDEVEALYTRLLADDPEDPEALGAYASWLWEWRRDDKGADRTWAEAERAVQALRKAPRTGREGEWEPNVLGAVRAENLCEHAHMLIAARKDRAGAVRKAKAAQTEESAGEMAAVVMARAARLGRGGVHDAIKVLEKWVAGEEGSRGLDKGELRFPKGNRSAMVYLTRESVECPRSVLRWRRRREPGAQAKVELGLLLAERSGSSDRQRAEALYRSVLKRDRWDEAALGALGCLLAKYGSNSQAVQMLRRAWRLSPHSMSDDALECFSELLDGEGDMAMARSVRCLKEEMRGGGAQESESGGRRGRESDKEKGGGTIEVRVGAASQGEDVNTTGNATVAAHESGEASRKRQREEAGRDEREQPRAVKRVSVVKAEGQKEEGQKEGVPWWRSSSAVSVAQKAQSAVSAVWERLRRWSGVWKESEEEKKTRQRREKRRVEKQERRWSEAVAAGKRIRRLEKSLDGMQTIYNKIEQEEEVGPDEEREKAAVKGEMKSVRKEISQLRRKLEHWGGQDGVATRVREKRGAKSAPSSLADLVERAKARQGADESDEITEIDDEDEEVAPPFSGFQHVVRSDGSAALVPAAGRKTGVAGKNTSEMGDTESTNRKPPAELNTTSGAAVSDGWASWTGDRKRHVADQIMQRAEVFGEKVVQLAKAMEEESASPRSLRNLASELEGRAIELQRRGRGRWARRVGRAAVTAHQAVIQSEDDAGTHATTWQRSGGRLTRQAGPRESEAKWDAWFGLVRLAANSKCISDPEADALFAGGVEAYSGSGLAWIARGSWLLDAKGDVGGAERMVEEAAKQGEGFVSLDLLRGRIASEAGRWTDAEKAFRKVVAATQADVGLGRRLRFLGLVGFGRLMLDRGDSSEAKRWLDQAGSLQPGQDDADVLGGLSRVLSHEEAAQDEAVTMAERALELDPSRRSVLLSAAEVMMTVSKHRERAEQVLANATRLRPWDWRVHVQRSRLKGHGGGARGAALREAVRVAPWSSEARGELARSMEEEGAVEGAEDMYEEALRVNPGDVRVMCGLAGLCQEELGDVQRARELLERALQLQPTHADSLFQSGSLAEEEGEEGERRALGLYRRAVSRDPGHVPALVSAGDLLAARGAHREAEGLYRQAVGARPDEARAVRNWAMMEEGRGRAETAEGLYRAAVTLDPADAIALNRLGMLTWAERGDRDGAVRALTEALREGGEDVVVLCNLADVLVQSESSAEEAEALLRRAVAAAPSDAAVLCKLGAIRATKMGGRGAVEAYQEALRVDPTSEEAARHMRFLEGE